LVSLVKGIIDFLVEEFALNEDTRALLSSASPATIDRKLRKRKKVYRLKGIHTTKPGTLLKNQIPIRVCFDRDEQATGLFPALVKGGLSAGFGRPCCTDMVIT
jgi:hypothetical protein